MLIIFSSCKEKETVDTCSNGFFDPGEEGLDCGGNCAPCEVSYVSSNFLKLNGLDMGFSNASINFDGSIYALQLSNDTIDIQINLGTDGSVGSFSIPQSGTICTYNGVSYPNITNATSAISANDQANQLMSGFYQINFYRTGFTDTIKITEGQFDFIGY